MSVPVLDYEDLDTLEEILSGSQPYISTLFPESEPKEPMVTPPTDVSSIFLSERSLSLWSQLIAPPPLAPPNWVRSRIRRLFLVSLGVPVDLDEILPASKQKKLVLPSINLPGERSPRPSMDSRGNPLERLKKKNDSTGSVDSSASASKRESKSAKRRGPPPPPDFDSSAAIRMGGTTTEALNGMENDELKTHVERLEDFQKRATEVLEYWLRRKDGAVGEKEALEGVIANLVEHAKKVRK